MCWLALEFVKQGNGIVSSMVRKKSSTEEEGNGKQFNPNPFFSNKLTVLPLVMLGSETRMLCNISSTQDSKGRA